MFDPSKILRHPIGGLTGFVQRKICLVWPFMYFVRYTCSFKFTFMRYFKYVFRPNSTIMSAWLTFGGVGTTFAADNLLAMDILYLVECNCSFYIDFIWYLLCLIHRKF